MPTSQNGYSANDRSVIASYTVPGTNLRIALRKGDVSVVLLEYLRRYNAEVEPLSHNPQDLWGYAERTIRGSSTTLSNHASGTAADCRATRHGLGATGTFTAAELTALNRLLAWFEGVIRHGKDYVGRKDPMHGEIDKGPPEVARIANKIRNRGSATGGASSVSAGEKDIVIDNRQVSGAGTLRLICPTGKAGLLTARAWISAVSSGPQGGSVRGWFQTDTGGISDFSWTVGFRDGLSDRPWAEFPDGASQVNLQYNFPSGGTLCLEALPK